MRLIIVVEGQTEEAFVKEVLKPHFESRGVYPAATVVGKLIAQKRSHRRRGGGHFRHWKRDIDRLLAEDSSDGLRVTTLFDLYGLPDDFPGLSEHGTDTDTLRRCRNLESTLAAEFDDHRFIPYLQRHEFEALVLSSLPALRDLLDAEDDLAGVAELEALVAGICPEDINDGEQTAPSKRLLKHVPGFSKALHGPLATAANGLDKLRKRCPGFAEWVRRLESIGSQA